MTRWLIAPCEGNYDSYKRGEIWLYLWLMLQARWGKMWLTMTHARIEGNYDFYIFLTSYWQLSLLKMWLVELAWASLMSQAKKLGRPQHWRVADNTTYINTPFIFFSKIFKIKFFFHILYWPQELSRGLMGSVTMRRKIHECNTLLGVSIITASSELKGHTPKYFCICAKKTAHNIISNMIVLVCIIVSGTIYWVARLQP